MAYYKATRIDGTDFHTGKIDYAKALMDGAPVYHPGPSPHQNVEHRHTLGVFGMDISRTNSGFYLSIATTPTDCTGMSFPLRLFEVEPEGDCWAPDPEGLPNKRACKALRVVKEISPRCALGPQARHIIDFWNKSRAITTREDEAMMVQYQYTSSTSRAYMGALRRMNGLAHDSGRMAACNMAVWEAGKHILYHGPCIEHTARALVLRDLLGTDDYQTLTKPWRVITGIQLHPEDD